MHVYGAPDAFKSAGARGAFDGRMPLIRDIDDTAARVSRGWSQQPPWALVIGFRCEAVGV